VEVLAYALMQPCCSRGRSGLTLIVDEWSEQFVQLSKFILLSQVQVLRYLCHSNVNPLLSA
ncbi:hypothetical protein KXW36_009709, partial [Aspergillus fumigatus]